MEKTHTEKTTYIHTHTPFPIPSSRPRLILLSWSPEWKEPLWSPLCQHPHSQKGLEVPGSRELGRSGEGSGRGQRGNQPSPGHRFPGLWGLIVNQESKNFSPRRTAEFTSWPPGSPWATYLALLSPIPWEPPHQATSEPNENFLSSKDYGEHTTPSTVQSRGREGKGTAWKSATLILSIKGRRHQGT